MLLNGVDRLEKAVFFCFCDIRISGADESKAARILPALCDRGLPDRFGNI